MRSSGSRLGLVLAASLAAAAAAISCSTSSAPAACQDTCNGCCEGDTCRPFSEQHFALCGTGGEACMVCQTGQDCQDGACVDVVPPDAGPPDSGPPPQDSGTECGHEGETCCRGNACFLPLSCQGSVCIDPTADAGSDAGSGAGPIGAACSGAADCQSGECNTTEFPEGYCTSSCSGGCPSGTACGTIVGSSKATCLAECAPPGQAGTSGGCRGGYVCEKNTSLVHTNGIAVCIPACGSGQTSQCGAATCDNRGFCSQREGYACCSGSNCGDAGSCVSGDSCGSDGYCVATGSTTSATGASCTADPQCSGSVCVPQTDAGVGNCPAVDSDGGATTCWPGGYCSQTCNLPDGGPNIGGCDGTAECANFGPGSNDCLETCTYDGASGGCRGGYICDKYTLANGRESCITACQSDSYCQTLGAAACDSTGFCCGGYLFRCCSNGPACNGGLTCGNDGGFGDGYCQ